MAIRSKAEMVLTFIWGSPGQLAGVFYIKEKKSQDARIITFLMLLFFILDVY